MNFGKEFNTFGNIEIENSLDLIILIFVLFFIINVISFLKNFKGKKNFKEGETPNLTVYYPLISSIISVIIRFMGALLVIICILTLIFFVLISSSYFSNLVLNNYFIWFLLLEVISLNLLVYHIIYSLSHIVKS